SQCPTVSQSNQSFCDLQAPTVADLVATNTGGGVRWYATATSTTPLASTIGLVNNEDYFVDSTAGTCGTRPSVTVTIYSAPTGLSFQGDCYSSPGEATVANLTATGHNIRWY